MALPACWPTATGILPTQHGVYLDDAITERLRYPDSPNRMWTRADEASCEIELVALAGGAWIYGAHFCCGNDCLTYAPSVLRNDYLFPSRRAALMSAYGYWRRKADHARRRAHRVLDDGWRKEALTQQRLAMRVADWLLSVSGSVPRGKTGDMFI